jgi:hypothetical protein
VTLCIFFVSYFALQKVVDWVLKVSIIDMSLNTFTRYVEGFL